MSINAMLSLDEAITVGLKRYRECYPFETVPQVLEDAANLTGTPGEEYHTVTISYGVVGAKEPFILFQALVDRSTGAVNVETEESVEILSRLELEIDDSDYV